MTNIEVFFSKLFGLALLTLLSFMAGFQLSYTSSGVRQSLNSAVFVLENHLQQLASIPLDVLQAQYVDVEFVVCISMGLFLFTLATHLMLKTICVSILYSLGRGIDENSDK